MHRIEGFFSEWVIKHRVIVIVLSVIIVAAAASGLRHLSFNNDYRAFFGEDNPELVAFNEVENTYTKSDNVFIVISPNGGDVFQPKVLGLIEDMTQDAWQMPHSRRVDSLQNFQNTYAEEDDLIVEDLYEEASDLSENDLQRIKKIALSDPLLFKRMVSEDGRVTAINIVLEYPKLNPNEELKEVVATTRQLIKDYEEKYPNVSFYVTGVSFLNTSFVEAGEGDVMTLVPISFVLMMIFMFFLLKSPSAVFGVMLVIIFSDMAALGMAGHIGIQLSPASVPSTQMIMVLAVANSIHILVSFIFSLEHKVPQGKALSESIRLNLQPIFLTSVTTMIGFLGMNFSEVPPFNDLGNIVAMGVFVSLCLSLTFLPALMSYLPVKVKYQEDSDVEKLAHFSTFVIKNQNFILVGMAAIVLLSGYFVTQNRAEEQFLKYFDESIQFRTDSDFAASTLGGLYQLVYSVPAEGKGGISEPAYLKNLDNFSQWLKQQPETINVYVLTDTMRRLNKNMHGDDAEWYTLPESRELAAQYLLLYEMSLPYGLDLNNQVNVDKSATRLFITVQAMSNVQLLDYESRIQVWLKGNVPTSMQAPGTGPMMMFAHISDKNINGMLKGSILALVLISIILIFALRSLKIGIISLVPNIVPVVIGFGIWGLVYVQVNMGLAIVVSMTLGIVVDDTVHFLSKYLRAKREKGYSTEKAITYAYTHVGKALVVSSIVLTVGFVVLMMSPFALNSDMAKLTTWIIAAALIVDFLLLPVLLLKFDKDEK
ncbi:MAG TPA: RND family transporter [Cycloclasticus sp.]|nr:RND family transporter [Cycloclasticus sp.]